MSSSRELTDASSVWALRDFAESLAGEAPTYDDYTISRARHADADVQHAALARTIEGEIIPRLMLTHKMGSGHAEIGDDSVSVLPEADEITEFAEIALRQPFDVGLAYLEVMKLRGISAETLYIDVIAPAARRLDEMWKADLCDFTDVTVALTRLQQMLTEFSPAFEFEAGRRISTRRALIVPCPGEQHTLGLFMVQEYFRRAGWQVPSVAPKDLSELKHVIVSHRFDVIGFSLSCDVRLNGLQSAIELTRKHAKNRAVGIMVGGQLFNQNPDLALRVGADATAPDGRQAVLRLPALLGKTASNW